jgi:hypothetical protein
MRMTPVEIGMKKASRSVPQPVGSGQDQPAGEGKFSHARRLGAWNETTSTQVQLARSKKNSPSLIFFLQACAVIVFFKR